MNTDGNLLTIEIDMSFAGVKTKLIKHLKRKQSFDFIPFRKFTRSVGWIDESLRSANTLREVSLRYVESYTVMSPSAKNILGDDSGRDNNLCITRRVGDKITDGDKVAIFKFEVSRAAVPLQ